MVKLILVLIFSAALSFAALYFSGGIVFPVITNALSAFLTIVMLFGALSFAFYNYLDAIMKDLPRKFLKEDPEKYENALNALTNLKKEVILNVIMMVVLFLLERGLMGVGEIIDSNTWDLPARMDWMLVSLRCAFLAAGVYAVFVQFFGFITANELRTVLMKQRD